ncbi:Phosphocarrier, HPr family protein [Paraburkholderia piptadeniae]|uniref:Phosphocarrier, HPr family protein n=1 Tax=Paraburkholderia piptadeniae TaxID=1701573 RepID=A0A1N7ST60_9BURK|nr:HPr family phosphocarrier protein [Paraburkholderia piptadeniae]SIT50660.1 Phosphocarrier, HPr family protein [Paraburkholderia piptadeniae]
MAEAWVDIGRQWNRQGHDIAGQALARTACRFESDIVLVANGRRGNAKDVMSIASLRARTGTAVQILASGPDEEDALRALASLCDDPSA